MTSNKDDETKSLGPARTDYVSSAIKGVLGAIPIAGSLLAELAETIIPNQRVDRIVEYAKILEKRLRRLEKDFVKSQLEDGAFTDLMEESLRQAASSLSNERREYIAALVANSLSSEDIEYQESRHLLNILGEINDVEVLWLRFYLVPTIVGDESFRERHKHVLERIHPAYGDSQEILDKHALQESYLNHLSRLGVLDPVYEKNMETDEPEFDTGTGGLKVGSYQLTDMGRLPPVTSNC